MLKLKEEFSGLFEFFKNADSIKMEDMKETLEETIRFSEKLKDRLINGTKEEKEELHEFLQEMQAKIEEEKNKLFQKIGVSEEDLKAFISNKENFSEEEWGAMQDMKHYVQETIEPEKNKPKKINRSKTQWIQS